MNFRLKSKPYAFGWTLDRRHLLKTQEAGCDEYESCFLSILRGRATIQFVFLISLLKNKSTVTRREMNGVSNRLISADTKADKERQKERERHGQANVTVI